MLFCFWEGHSFSCANTAAPQESAAMGRNYHAVNLTAKVPALSTSDPLVLWFSHPYRSHPATDA